MLNKNILITGGAGYIGSHFSNYLNKKKNKIFVIDDLSRGRKERLNKNITFTKFAYQYQKTKLFLKIIFHCYTFAGKINAQESKKKKEYLETNYDYSRKLYEAAINSNVSKFIFASSAAVYGDYKTLFKETDKTKQ